MSVSFTHFGAASTECEPGDWSWAGRYRLYAFMLLFCWSCRRCLPRPSTCHAVKCIRQ